MMKYVPVYALFLVFVFYTSCKGQNKTDLPKDTFKSETKDVVTSRGPNTLVRTIKQDRNGNIWLASNEGIFRYDGKSFTKIIGNLSSDSFFSVLEDRKGNFWFAAYGSGVYYYDGKSFQQFTTQQGLANNRVSTIHEDKTGNIWFGADGGVSRYDGKSFQNFKTEGGISANEGGRPHSYEMFHQNCLDSTFSSRSKSMLTRFRKVPSEKSYSPWSVGLIV